MSEGKSSTNHTVAVFKTHEAAEAAVKLLNASGFDMKNLSVIGQHYSTEEHPVGFVNAGDRMLTWGKFGAFWGSIWGLLIGSAVMFVPGVGMVATAGWIVSALAGAVLGGGAAALGGALASIGVPNDSVIRYESELKAGSFLLLAHGTEADVERAKELLSSTLAVSVDSFSTKATAVGK